MLFITLPTYMVWTPHILPSVIIKIPRNETYKKYNFFHFISMAERKKKHHRLNKRIYRSRYVLNFFISSFQSKLLFLKIVLNRAIWEKPLISRRKNWDFHYGVLRARRKKNNKKLINLHTIHRGTSMRLINKALHILLTHHTQQDYKKLFFLI